ncbi:hypothetical protein K227x_64320 [Rubripirellula lacrimiformis]|uniref:Uncharacterized protein n=1 Tax=Rubripirellula lacrimiformis TaxID=1930273 RepID=A0A517NLK0_9BACT|nr:hypothetical protein [Rubripirellula lacrimiformis]QDT08002.1 hypothetical protein K227x_64320 [Rubripirellula lacrimiformis]
MKSLTYAVKAARPFNVEGNSIEVGSVVAAIHTFGGVDIGTLRSLLSTCDRLQIECFDDDGEVEDDAPDADDPNSESGSDIETQSAPGSEADEAQAEAEANTESESDANADSTDETEAEVPDDPSPQGLSDDTRLDTVLESDFAEKYAEENVETRGELVEWLANGNKLTTPNGIGPKSALKIAEILGL